MQVHYRAVGEIKQKLERPEGMITLNGSSDVNQLLDKLGVDDDDLVVMVNGRKADGSDRLQDGDQVVIVPFVVGG